MSEIINTSSEQEVSQEFSEGISERELLIIRVVDEYVEDIEGRLFFSTRLNSLPDEILDSINDILNKLGESFEKGASLIKLLIDLPSEFFDGSEYSIRFVNNTCFVQFLNDEDYRATVIEKYYRIRYPYLSGFKLEGYDLLEAVLVSHDDFNQCYFVPT